MTPRRAYGDLFALSAEVIKAGTQVPEQMAKKRASEKPRKGRKKKKKG